MKHSFALIAVISALVISPNVSAQVKDDDIVFTKAQVSPKFIGGIDAWIDFLINTTDKYTAAKRGAPVGSYAVKVEFVIDTTGNVTNVKALNDPGFGTAEDAILSIQLSPKWVPAVQNGNKVKFRQVQMITYAVAEPEKSGN